MNVFDYAMKMEQDGRELYLDIAARATTEGVKTIFRMLAEDERKHYEVFRDLKAQPRLRLMEESTTLEQTRNLFERLRFQRQEMAALGASLPTYLKAMEIEAESVKLYEEAAQKEANPEVKRLLLRIAGEEKQHYNILENLYVFANAPNQYLAWGEFTNTATFHQFGRNVDE